MENIASGKPHLVFLSLAKLSPSENSCDVFLWKIEKKNLKHAPGGCQPQPWESERRGMVGMDDIFWYLHIP